MCERTVSEEWEQREQIDRIGLASI